MFTGLIEQTGRVVANSQEASGQRLQIQASFDAMHPGESIAVNGVCLTLLPHPDELLMFDVSFETIQCASLGALKPGDRVNLERAMQAGGRFGGHYVNGHVDTTVSIQSIKRIDDYVQMVTGPFPGSMMSYLLPKGSITLDGVSLTINTVNHQSIEVLLIPHTLTHTALGTREVGDYLNVEFDYLTRIVAHQLKCLVPDLEGLSNEVQS